MTIREELADELGLLETALDDLTATLLQRRAKRGDWR